MFKHILAALDGSPRAPKVLRHAADLAARTGAVLHLCRAVHLPLDVPADAFTLTGDELAARLLEHGTQELAAMAQALTPPVTPIVWGERVCRFGVPGQVIVEVADELHVDVIVIGSHGYHMVERILGTTAARIVNHAHCSVLVVRADAAAAE
jgi:nucleotide-binding universal stress UspA family protein